MRLGAHISTAGGVAKAFRRAAQATCDTMMVFTKSNRQWQARPLTEDDLRDYREAQAQFSQIHPVAVHASYLINVASPDEALWQKSYQALKVEVERADFLGIPWLTFHPGSHMREGEEAGLANVARALQRLLAETEGCHTVVCLETMAGQGTNLGSRFEQLAWLLQEVGPGPRLGVCFDTCHVFAAGYDLRTPEAYQATMAELDRVLGLEHVRCFHLNDSKFPLGSGKDRHAHIGDGEIGLEGFASFVNDRRWAAHPAHLETPKTETDEAGNEVEMDPVNLARLRSLIS